MPLSSLVFLEAHSSAATVYVVGWLGDAAAARTEELVGALPATIRWLRLDLSAVEMLDPVAFIRVARAARRSRPDRKDPPSFATAGHRWAGLRLESRAPLHDA